MFELYSLDELKAEMRQDAEAVDAMADAAMRHVLDWIDREAEREEALAEQTRKTTARNKG